MTKKTPLSGDDVNMSSVALVPGSDDERVGVVMNLERLDGTRRMNGGRGVLRWRRGDAKADFRPIPGHSSLTPKWRLTRNMGFIERGAPGEPARKFDLDSIVPRGMEWAGVAIYVAAPEALWIGLDGRGRGYARVDLADVERRAQVAR